MTDAFTPAEGSAAGNLNRNGGSGACGFSAPERRCSSGSGAVRYTARARGGSRGGGGGSGATAAEGAAGTAVVPAAARSLNRMPLELMGTVLEFVDARSLLTAGMVSKPLRNLIEVRKLWKWHFKLKEKTDPDWSMPPPEMQPADWRVCYWQYKKELQGPPICVLRRGDISRRYRWRVGAINKKIPHPHDIHESMMFFMTYRTRAGTEVVVGWQLQIQRFVKNEEDVYFVFVRTEHPVHCVFRISLLNHKYEVFNSRIAAKSFDGKSGGKTGGCLFPVKQMAEQQMGNQLLIEIDVTVFPGGLDRVEPVYQLLTCMSDDSQMVSCIIELLGDYVKRSPVSVKAKHYMQTVGGGPLSLVAICENPDAAPLLKASAAGCLWNILDTSCLYITKSTVERIVKVACSELSQHLQMLDGFSKDTVCEGAGVCTRVQRNKQQQQQQPHRATQPSDQISFVYPPSDALPQAEVRITSVNAMCGLLWNIPVSDENRYGVAIFSISPSIVSPTPLPPTPPAPHPTGNSW